MKTLRSETGPTLPPGASPVVTENTPERRRGGRPRQWVSTAERNRAAGQRHTERSRLLAELHLALLNARWEDADLRRLVNTGEELEVLRALIAHTRRQHWARGSETTRAEGQPDKSAA